MEALPQVRSDGASTLQALRAEGEAVRRNEGRQPAEAGESGKPLVPWNLQREYGPVDTLILDR